MSADSDRGQFVDAVKAALPPTGGIIGIDGPGASGKTTFAGSLAAALPSAAIVALDDFYLPSRDRPAGRLVPGAAYDWLRVLGQVLEPLASGTPARYQRYHWERDRLGEWVMLACDAVTIIEGVYALRPEFRPFYAYSVWVEAPASERLRRGLERDGVEARARWVDEWMPAEDAYAISERPFDHADLLLDGGGPAAFKGWRRLDRSAFGRLWPDQSRGLAP